MKAPPSSPVPAPPVRARLDFLDGLRALAALYVVVFHAFSYQWAHQSDPAFRLMRPLLFGHQAVDVFIVLSGFSLMLPVAQGDGHLRGGAVAFFKRRARRILPPYYAALVLCLALDWTLLSHTTGGAWLSALPVTASGILAHLFLVQDVLLSTSTKINSPMWSISVEWRIYFCFPLLVWAWRRWGAWATVALTFAAAAAINFLLSQEMVVRQFQGSLNLGEVGISPQYLGLFALGMLGAEVAFGRAGWLNVSRRRALLAAAFALMSAGTYCLPHTLFRSDTLTGLAAMGMLIAAARGSGGGWLRRALSWRPLVWVGTFAYSLYLLHLACLQIVWQYLVHPLHLAWRMEFLLHVLVGLAAALGISYLFFLACERPFLVRRKAETLADAAQDAALAPAP